MAARAKKWTEADPFNPEFDARMRVIRETSHADMLRRLEEYALEGYRHVKWRSSADAHCHLCRKRDGKMFTIAAARKLLAKSYCCFREDGYEMFCRCLLEPQRNGTAWMNAVDPLAALEQEIALRSGEPTATDQLPLAGQPDRAAALQTLVATVMPVLRSAVKGIESLSDAEAARQILARQPIVDQLLGLLDPKVHSAFLLALRHLAEGAAPARRDGVGVIQPTARVEARPEPVELAADFDADAKRLEAEREAPPPSELAEESAFERAKRLLS